MRYSRSLRDSIFAPRRPLPPTTPTAYDGNINIACWQSIAGRDPQWLYFDSKLALYSELSRVNQRGICFVTIRRRCAAVLRRLHALPAHTWRQTVVDIPKRRHQHVRYIDETVKLR